MVGRSSQIVFIILLTSVTSKLHLDSNGYKGVVVTISPEISEDPNILTRLETIFTEASAALFRATKNQIFFKEFIIVIPKVWQVKDTYKDVSAVDLDKGDFIIDIPNLSNGNEPYTKHFAECGKPGLYIHLTPDYVLDNRVAEQWGAPGKVVVHEWAHYRWGLFDEYPVDGQDAYFYQLKSLWSPTRCPEETKGDYQHLGQSIKCKFLFKLGRFEDGCVFVPKSDSQKESASLLYASYEEKVVEFCDDPDTSPSHLKHNRHAPNRQNRLCKYQSAWEVMRKNEDFISLLNKTALPDGTDTTPIYHYVQEKPRSRVLVLDTSGSMQGTFLELLRQAASIYIMGIIETGSRLGIVRFSSSASILSEIVDVESEEDREALVGRLPTSASGLTSIGSGLYKALQMLTSDTNSRSGSIILITDGQENVSPYISQILPSLIDEGIVVHSVAYSQNADEGIAALSEATGGRVIYYSGNADSTAHIDGLSATVTSTNTIITSKDAPISILTEAKVLTAGVTLTGTFHIDSTIGKNTILTVTYSNSITIEVVRPNGLVLEQLQKHTLATNVDMIVLEDDLTPGTWSYLVTTSAFSSNIVVDVQSKPRQEGKEVLQIHSWISQKEDVIFSSRTTLEIYAEVNKGKASVTGANVTATVERPNAATLNLPLKDNGIGADIFKDDGIYSANIIAKDLTGNGRYNIKINVVGSKTETKVTIQGSGTASRAFRRPGTGGIPETITSEPLEDFQRVATAGEFRLQSFFEGVQDELPPARITNFQSISIDYDQQTAHLSWTAVGGDMDRGQASGYIICISSDLDVILTNRTNADRLSDKDIILGNLNTSLEPGEVEEFTVSIPSLDVNETIYLSVIAVDEAGNEGEPSNIVSLSRAEGVYGFKEDNADNDDDTSTLLIVGISVGGTCFLLIATIIVICSIKTKKSITASVGILMINKELF